MRIFCLCYASWRKTFAHPRWAIRAACWTILFLLAFQLVQIVPYFYFFQYDSEGLVRQTVQTGVEQGKPSPPVYNGLMVFANNRLGSPQLLYNAPLSETTPYISQVGIQARLLAALAPDTIAGLPLYFDIARGIVALLFAGLLACWLATLTSQIGSVATLIVGGLCLATPPLYLFCSNLYWIAPLFFAPMIFAWCLYGKLSSAWFYGGLFLLFIAKLLVGYEFYSNIAAMPLLPIAWYGWQQGKGWQWLLGRAAMIGSLCITAFILVLYYHLTLIQGAMPDVSNWREALAVLGERIINRTVGDDVYAPNLARDIAKYAAYYIGYPVPLSLQTLLMNQGSIILVSGGLILLSGRWLAASLNLTKKQLLLLVGLALAITVTWHGLAFGHMRHHKHINFITFIMPLNLLLYMLWGIAGQRYWQHYMSSKTASN